MADHACGSQHPESKRGGVGFRARGVARDGWPRGTEFAQPCFSFADSLCSKCLSPPGSGRCEGGCLEELLGPGLLKGEAGVQEHRPPTMCGIGQLLKKSDKPLHTKATSQHHTFLRSAVTSKVTREALRSTGWSSSPFALS